MYELCVKKNLFANININIKVQIRISDALNNICFEERYICF